MFGIWEKIQEAIQKFLIEIIQSNLANMFTDVNEKVGTIAVEVGQTPQGWNGNILSMIQNISESVIVPIAGLIITYVLCYELISMIIEKNNMHDIDTFMFFKYFFKACVTVFLVTRTFDITMAIFDVAQVVISKSATVISESASIDIETALAAMTATMETMGIGELLLLMLETMIIQFSLKIMAILITVVLYGRMIEIYLYCSVAPIPFATFSNREWNIGNNYIKGLLSLGFQGFFIMICVAIYAVLVNSMTYSTNIHSAVFQIATYTVILCFSLFKTGSLAKSVFGSH